MIESEAIFKKRTFFQRIGFSIFPGFVRSVGNPARSDRGGNPHSKSDIRRQLVLSSVPQTSIISHNIHKNEN